MMAHRLYDDDKIKLILLYLLHELDDSFDFQTISEIIVWDGSINYFVFTQCFNELVENGSIQKDIDPQTGKEMFSISPMGKQSIEEVEDSLLKFIKERFMRSAVRLLAFKKDGTTIASHYDKEKDGYLLQCTIKNKKFDLLHLDLYLDNEEEAKILQHGFDLRAEYIYSGILALLTDDTRYFQ